MDTNDLVAYYGSRQKVQDKLRLSKQLFSTWQRDGIPMGRQALIQIETRGKLRINGDKKASA